MEGAGAIMSTFAIRRQPGGVQDITPVSRGSSKLRAAIL
jgi:hypothetical protein